MPPPKLVWSCTTGIAALAGEAPHRAHQHPLQALGEIRAAEKLDRLPVFVRPLAQMHLPEIGGELGLLVATAGHVLVRRHYLAPGLEVRRRRALDGRARALALFASHLLVEAQAQKLHLHLFDLVGLRCRDGRQQPASRVERAIGIVAGKCLLVRPPVPMVAEFAHEAALGGSQRPAEDIVPRIPHQLEQAATSHSRDRLLAAIGDLRRGSARPRRGSDLCTMLLNSRSTKGPSPCFRNSIALPTRS